MDTIQATRSAKHRAAEAHEFLAKAVEILATSLDLKSTIDGMARLAVSRLADWCAVFMFENDQTIRRLTVVQIGAIAFISADPRGASAGVGQGAVFTLKFPIPSRKAATATS